jgi:hypothetical protein
MNEEQVIKETLDLTIGEINKAATIRHPEIFFDDDYIPELMHKLQKWMDDEYVCIHSLSLIFGLMLTEHMLLSFRQKNKREKAGNN